MDNENIGYGIYLIDNKYLKSYMDENNCPKNKVSLNFIKKEGTRLYHAANRNEFNNMMEFYYITYASHFSTVVAYNLEDESYIEW